MKLGEIVDGFEIFERFLITKNKSVVVVGAIVLPESENNPEQKNQFVSEVCITHDQGKSLVPSDSRNNLDKQMKYSLNLYKLNDQEEADIYLQFKFYAGEVKKTIVNGNHDDILNFIKTGHLATPYEEGRVKTWFNQNKENLGTIFGNFLALGVFFLFLKRKKMI